MKHACSPIFRKKMMEKYPALQKSVGYRLLFTIIVLRADRRKGDSWSEKNTTALPYRLLGKLAGKDLQAKNRNFSGGAFLNAFKQDVLPNFAWSPGRTNFAHRAVICNGLDKEDQLWIDDDMNNHFFSETSKVFFKDGKPANSRNELLLKDERAMYDVYDLDDLESNNVNFKRMKVSSDHKQILSLLEKNSLDGRAVKMIMGTNHDKIRAILNSVGTEERFLLMKYLCSIKEDARVVYAPGDRGIRWFPRGMSVLNLPTKMRKAVCSGWSDIDLRSSQLTIFASQVGAKQTIAAISDPSFNIWQDLQQKDKASLDLEMKGFHKEFIYSLVYGRVDYMLEQYAQKLGINDIFNHFVIKELIECRPQYFDTLKNNGKIRDIWGKEHLPYKRSNIAGQLAALKNQSIELKIIAAVAGALKNSKYATVQLWQHDGFTISFSDKREKEKVRNECQSAIDLALKDIALLENQDLMKMYIDIEDL